MGKGPDDPTTLTHKSSATGNTLSSSPAPRPPSISAQYRGVSCCWTQQGLGLAVDSGLSLPAQAPGRTMTPGWRHSRSLRRAPSLRPLSPCPCPCMAAAPKGPTFCLLNCY